MKDIAKMGLFFVIGAFAGAAAKTLFDDIMFGDDDDFYDLGCFCDDCCGCDCDCKCDDCDEEKTED